MTAKIVSLADFLHAAIDELPDVPPSDDDFLLDEGLELLSSYRSIRDRAMRLKIKSLIEMIALDQKG